MLAASQRHHDEGKHHSSGLVPPLHHPVPHHHHHPHLHPHHPHHAAMAGLGLGLAGLGSGGNVSCSPAPDSSQDGVDDEKLDVVGTSDGRDAGSPLHISDGKPNPLKACR